MEKFAEDEFQSGVLTVDAHESSSSALQGLLQSLIVPRPIALASTVDTVGHVNLSPFSFFNMFSTKPPILIFSPSRRVRNNTTKHTLENVLRVPEVVINIVTYNMVEQVSLSSVEFPHGVDEFVKSGLTPVKSVKVKPPRVAESPAAFECRVNKIIPLGDQGGAGNLVICEVLLAHVKREILNDKNKVDPFKLDAVARMGGDYYCRAAGEALFAVPKPTDKIAVGYDQIPERFRHSRILTGNDLARLANIQQLPEVEEVDMMKAKPEVTWALTGDEETMHKYVKRLIAENRIREAWMVLLSAQ